MVKDRWSIIGQPLSPVHSVVLLDYHLLDFWLFSSCVSCRVTGVSGIKHRRTSPTTAFQCPMLPVAGTCDPPAAINWLFHVSAAAPLLVLQSGIHCLTVCAIQLLDQTSFDAV